MVRGDKELPIFGLPDIIASVGTAPYKKGMRKVVSGESYIELVKYTPECVEIESIISYGSSDHPDSKHFNDQMKQFASQKTKKMTFDKEEIYQKAKAIYNPM